MPERLPLFDVKDGLDFSNAEATVAGLDWRA